VVLSNKPDGIDVISVPLNAEPILFVVKPSIKVDGIDVIEEPLNIPDRLLDPELPPNKSDGILNKDVLLMNTLPKLQLAAVLNTFEPTDVKEEQEPKVRKQLFAAILFWNK
jgi:hypothetical protein